MNSKNISLFNYVYSGIFDNLKENELKWEEFNSLCKKYMDYTPYDFIVKNKELVIMNEKNMWVDLLGNKETVGDFVSLNYLGQKEFVEYKIKEIISLIEKFGMNAFKNLNNIFESMCCESIKSILLECRNRNLIDFEDYIFIEADIVGTIKIRFEEIKVNISKKENDFGFNGITLNNYGSLINQMGNNNNANISINDEQLFLVLEEKIEALKIEMQNKNCEEKIKELENAIKKKDKKSILSILSELASIGSFIAAMFIK